jgi:Tfp pilus assembly protein PilO
MTSTLRLPKLALTPRLLVAALVGTLVLLAAATWFVLVEPKQTQASNLATQIQNEQSTLQTKQEMIRHRATSKIPNQGLFIRRALPDTEAMPQILLELNRIATSVGASLQTVTPGSLTSYTGYAAEPLSITVTGRFFAIESFLRALRDQVEVTTSDEITSTGRLFDVLSLNLTQAKAPLVSAQLSIAAFYYLNVAPVTPTTTPAT